MLRPILFPAPWRLVLLCRLAIVVGLAALPGVSQAADKGTCLLFGHRPDGLELKPELTLRPNLLQPIYVYVRNGTNCTADMVVEVCANGEVVEGGRASVQVTAGRKALVPFGKVASVPAKELMLMPLTGATEIRLLSGDNLLQEVKIGVARPADYVRISSVEFDPRERLGIKNRLVVRVEATKNFSGPKCKAELVVRADRVPGLVAGRHEGTYAGTLSQAGDVITLVAENLEFKPGAENNGLVYVNVDGYARAFTWAVPFGSEQSLVLGEEVRQPVMRIVAPTTSAPSSAYHVNVEVDNAPAGAQAELSVIRPGREEEGADCEVVKFSGERRSRLLLGIGGLPGALVFKPTMQDWSADLDIAEVYGKRAVMLRLLAGEKGEVLTTLDSRQVGSWKAATENRTPMVTLPIVLDATRPEQVRFLDFPAQLGRRGSGVPIQAAAQDPESGIVSAVFFTGKPLADGTIPESAVVVDGKLNRISQAWTAEMPIETNQPRSQVVSVRFTNGAGLVTTESVRIQLVDSSAASTPPAPPAPSKKSGTIAGTVLEGARPQPQLAVTLTDERSTVRATTRTDATGKFVFENVAPGSYRVGAVHSASRTKGETTVIVGDGQVKTSTDIKLAR